MRRFIAYSALYGGTAALQKMLGFALFLWLARALKVGEYANFGLLYALQQGLTTLASAGVVEAVVGQLGTHKQPTRRTQLFENASLAFFALAFAAIVLAVSAWWVLPGHFDASLLTFVSVVSCGILLAITSFQAQLVRLNEDHVWSLLLTCVPTFSGLFGGFLAFAFEQSLQSFFIGSAIGVILAALALWCFRRVLLRVNLEPPVIRRILVGAIPFLIVAFLGWLSGYGNNYLINLMLPKTEVANFTFALSLCSVMLLVAGALNQVWSPRFYQLIHQRPFEQVELQNGRFYRALAVALGFAGGLVTIVFPWVMRLLGGNLRNYQHMTLELSLLFSGYVILTPWWQCQNHFLSHGLGRSILKITVITSIAGVTTLLLLMWFLGPIGIYVGFLAQMILRSAAIVVEARKRWPVQVSGAGIFVGLAMIGIGFFSAALSPVPLLPEVGYTLICAVLVYVFLRQDVTRLVARRASL